MLLLVTMFDYMNTKSPVTVLNDGFIVFGGHPLYMKLILSIIHDKYGVDTDGVLNCSKHQHIQYVYNNVKEYVTLSRVVDNVIIDMEYITFEPEYEYDKEYFSVNGDDYFRLNIIIAKFRTTEDFHQFMLQQ